MQVCKLAIGTVLHLKDIMAGIQSLITLTRLLFLSHTYIQTLSVRYGGWDRGWLWYVINIVSNKYKKYYIIIVFIFIIYQIIYWDKSCLLLDKWHTTLYTWAWKYHMCDVWWRYVYFQVRRIFVWYEWVWLSTRGISLIRERRLCWPPQSQSSVKYVIMEIILKIRSGSIVSYIEALLLYCKNKLNY